MKTVRDILKFGGLRLVEKHKYEHVKDEKTGEIHWDKKLTGKFKIENAFAGEGEILGNNMDKPLLFAYSSGPNVLFAFKIRGGMAMYRLNAGIEDRFSSRRIERIKYFKYFERQLKILKKANEFKVDIKTPEFDTYTVMESLK